MCLIGCGILQKEVRFLIAKNSWPVSTDFLPPSLHIDYKRLARALRAGLARHTHEQTLVFYGACHPGMDELLKQARTQRIPGQNCIEMLLGAEVFNRYLAEGAFFLLDDWVQNWDTVITQTFGSNIDVTRDIFHACHRYLLALRTPLSADFSKDAQRISEMLALPLKWRDVDLNHLEAVLQTAIESKSDAPYG